MSVFFKVHSLPILPAFVVCLFLISLNNCTKTATFHGHQLGWNNDNVYILRVAGIWDRNTYYIDGEKNSIENLGKIGVSAFELKRQAEIFARTRAVFTFQEKMEEYFENFDFEQISDQTPDPDLQNEEGSVTNSGSTDVDAINGSLTTTVDPAQILVTSNENPRVFYENPNQNTNVIIETEPTIDLSSTNVNESMIESITHIKKTIDFRELYDKVDLKITLLEKIYADDHDVDVIYIFSGRNLKQELARAFNTAGGEIEFKK